MATAPALVHSRRARTVRTARHGGVRRLRRRWCRCTAPRRLRHHPRDHTLRMPVRAHHGRPHADTGRLHGRLPGGAALLQVGGTQKAAKEHAQPPLPADVDPQDSWAGELLAQVGEGMGSGTIVARTDADCERCAFRRSCPMQESGRQVTR